LLCSKTLGWSKITRRGRNRMGHISFSFMLINLLCGNLNIIKKNTEALLNNSREVYLEIKAEKY
jgi:hypothetical protein